MKLKIRKNSELKIRIIVKLKIHTIEKMKINFQIGILKENQEEIPDLKSESMTKLQPNWIYLCLTDPSCNYFSLSGSQFSLDFINIS